MARDPFWTINRSSSSPLIAGPDGYLIRPRRLKRFCSKISSIARRPAAFRSFRAIMNRPARDGIMT